MKDTNLYHHVLLAAKNLDRVSRIARNASRTELGSWIDVLNGWHEDEAHAELAELQMRLNQLASFAERIQEDLVNHPKTTFGFDEDELDGNNAMDELTPAVNEDLKAYHERCGVPLHNSLTPIRDRLVEIFNKT